MIKFPFWLTSKEFDGRKIRLFLNILPVALVVGFCIFIELASYSRTESVKKKTYTISPSIRVLPEGLTHDLLLQNGSGGKTIRQEITVEIEEKFNEEISVAVGRMIIKYKTENIDYMIIGLNPADIITPFDYLKELNGNEAALGSDASKKINAHEGGIISMDGKDLRIKHLLPSNGSFDDTTVLVTLKTAQDITKMAGRINEISIYLRAGVNPLDISARLKNNYPGLIVQTVHAGNSGEKPLESALDVYGLLIHASGAAIMIIYIFILALLNARERKLEISTLYAIGASGRGVMIMLSVRSVIVGVAGSIIGSAAGTLIIFMFNADPFTAVVLNGKLYVLAILISAGVSMIATLPAAHVSGYRNHVQVLQESWGC